MSNILSKFFSGLTHTQDTLNEQDVERGIKAFSRDGYCSISMATLQGGPILSAFAVAIGASNYEIGLIATIAFVGQFMLLPGLFLVNVFPKRRALNFIAAGISRIIWLPIILMPFLFIDRGVTFFLQWYLISLLFGSLSSPAWNSWLRDILPHDRLGSIVSKRLFVSTTIAVFCTLIAGYSIDLWKQQFPAHPNLVYSFLFLFGLAFGLRGIFYIADMPETKMKIDKKEPIYKQLKDPFQDFNFSKLLMYTGTWTFAVNLAGPFFVVYMLKRIHLSVFWVTLLTVMSQLANITFVRIWGRLADKYSNKSVLSVSTFFFLISVVGWCFTTLPERYPLTMPLLFLIHILSGAATAGVSLATTNISLKLAHPHRAHVYMAVFGLVGTIAGAIAPMLGGTLADFFQVRELGITIDWRSPGKDVAVSAINLRALDFLFILAFIVGSISRKLLAKVKEEGEVDDEGIIDELLVEMTNPVRSISSLVGLRRIVNMPISIYNRLKRG